MSFFVRALCALPAVAVASAALACPLHKNDAGASARITVAQAAASDTIAKAAKAGGISIEMPWSRATPRGAQIAAGYLKVTNSGKEADRLTGGSFPNAARVEIHEMKMEGGVMTMRPIAGGVEIKPGETIEFKPGGHHLMFMGLKQGLKDGDNVQGTLTFEKAGTIAVEYRVAPIGARAAPTASGREHMQH